MTSLNSEAPARQRIAKLMARVGLCSRRDAEAWIVDGRVSVNGEVLTSPATDVGPDDAILVDGAPLPAAEKTRLFLFHKPRGLVTSDKDPEGRATVADFLRDHWPDGPRVVTIGRLDINTEGLLLLTNDGGLARMLELPKTGWLRRYRVRAKGETDQAVLDGLRDGVTIDGMDYAGIEATLDRTQGANVWLTMGLREGKNREVKRVLEAIGLEVNRLIRLSFGPFQLGDLAEGAVEEVRSRVLRDQLGAALAAAAGVAFEDAAPPRDAKPARADRKPGRTTGAEQVNRGAPRAETRARDGRDDRKPRGERSRGGDRPLRRAPADAPPPIRERPAAGPRKHVSALRAEEADAARRGPRRRIERSDVTDRRERSVRVERLVGAAPLEPTRTRGGARRRDDADAPGGRGRRQASPSALAKRARTARSGGEGPRGSGHGPDRDDAAPPRRRDRPVDAARAEAGGGKFDTKRPRRDEAEAPRRAQRPRGAGGGRRAAEESRPGARHANRHEGGGRRDARPSEGRVRRPRRDEDAPSRAAAPRGERRPARERAGPDERPGKARRADAPRSQGRSDRPARGEARKGEAPKNRSRPPERRGDRAPDTGRRGGPPGASNRPDGSRPRGPSRGKPGRPKR